LQNWLNNLIDNDFTKIDNGKLGEEAWLFTKPNAAIILGKMNRHQRKAKDVFEKIFQGIATSLDDVYFIHDCELDGNILTGYSKALDKIVKVEYDLFKPLLKGDNVHRWEDLSSNSYVLFPYQISYENGKEIGKVMSPKSIQSQFPLGWKYILGCETLIKGRERGKLSNDVDFYKYIYPKSLTLFSKKKLLSRDICQKSQFTIDEDGTYYTTTTVYGYIKSEQIKESYKYFLAILNSQLTWYFMTNTAAVLANGYYRYMPRYISELPLPEATSKTELPFIYLADYILFLKALPVESPINEHVPNSHLVQLFEEVIDALVYELYFEEDFKKSGIEFIKYAERDFENIEGKPELEQIEIINKAYLKLNEKDNEIRNNLKLMDIKLADIVMPIKY
jgi:hypothetical protein